MSVWYGAWELKLGYQRNLRFGFICSIFLFISLFVVLLLFTRIQIPLADSKSHTTRIRLFQAFLRPANAASVEPSKPSNRPVQTAKDDRLLIDIPNKTPILKWPKTPLFAGDGFAKMGLAGIGDQARSLSDSSSDSVINLDEFDLKPAVLYKADPKCPELARRGRITGTVTAVVLVGKNGLVQEVSIKNSSNVIFDDEVLAALRRWVFRPWVERNRRLPFRFTVLVEFVLL